MKHIKNFTIFLFESEEFTEEDYLNWKEFMRKKHARWRGILPNYKPTEEEGESSRKYIRLRKKGLDPIAPFQKKEEVFTEEDYLNWKEYTRKKGILPSYKPTEEERESYNKYNRQRKKGLDPIAPFRNLEEEEFTKEDYLNWQQYTKKKNILPNFKPTEEEREAKNKYGRQLRKGLDPIAPFRREEEEFTKEDYLNWQQYTKKKNILPNFKPTEEEREAKNKYTRQRKKGIDPIAPFRKKN